MAGTPEASAGKALAGPRPRSARRVRWWRIGAPVARHALLLLVTLLFMGPFFWMVSSGLKSNDQVFSRPIAWLPNPVRWSNIGDVLTDPNFPFLRFLWNSTYYAGSVALGTTFSCALISYGFARLRFPGRTLLFAITIGTVMIPDIVTFIPTYVLFKHLNLIGNYVPLILPAFLGGGITANGFFIFMLRQFFMGLPWELSEAAKVDGAGEWRIFWNIMLPLVRSALIVVAVFSFVWTWQEFFKPFIYLSDPGQYPLALGLFAFRAQRTTDWALMMMASTIITAPLVALFFLTQRYFIQGITLTGLKG